MSKDRIYIIDFDSTIVQVEALDELASISLKGKKNQGEVARQIADITQLGMEGRLAIDESLEQRLALLKAGKEHIEELVKLLKKKITPSFARNRDFLKKYAKQIYVFTAGFHEYVAPVITQRAP